MTSSDTDEPAGADADEFLRLLQRIARGLRHAVPVSVVEDEIRAAGLSDRHLAAVVLLSITGPLTVSEFADQLGIARASTSLIVTELSRKGFVNRGEDENDLRRTIVSVDPGHAEAIAEFRRGRATLVERGLRGLSKRERAALIGTLTAIADSVAPPTRT